jgi:hypothetical protein
MHECRHNDVVIQIIVGDFGLSFEQQKAQLALWSIFAAVS